MFKKQHSEALEADLDLNGPAVEGLHCNTSNWMSKAKRLITEGARMTDAKKKNRRLRHGSKAQNDIK